MTGPHRGVPEISVPPEAAGERLDRFVAALDGVGSRASAERLLAEGKVVVDGGHRPKSHRLEAGERVAYELPATAPGLESEPVPLRIAWEDEHLLVVDKPAGVVVHRITRRDRELLAMIRELGICTHQQAHTALADVHESIEELAHYREHFLRLP